PTLEQILHASRARPVGRDKWLGFHHGEKHPSLSIRLTSTGAILLHCFSGCSQADVISSFGLQPNDLFPSRTPLSREELRAIAAEHRKQERLKRGWDIVEKAAAARIRQRVKESTAYSRELAELSDGSPRERELCFLFHRTLDLLRGSEALADRIHKARVQR